MGLTSTSRSSSGTSISLSESESGIDSVISGRQLTLIETYRKKEKWGKEDPHQGATERDILYWLIDDMLPMQTVASDRFRKIFERAVPKLTGLLKFATLL